jgi:hypothetical protein
MGALNDKCRVFWFGNAVDIPAGWSEDTNYQDRHLAGVPIGGTAGDTGGGHHGHDGLPHLHAGTEHEHDIAVNSQTTGLNFKKQEKTPGAASAVQGPHVHAGTAVHDSADTGETTVNAVTSDDYSDTMPLSREAFVIKPDGVTFPDVPTDAVIFTDNPDGLAGYDVCDGNGGRPNLEALFILGCPDGREAGGALDGAANHTHTRSDANHTHAMGDHEGGVHAMNPTGTTLNVIIQASPGWSQGSHYHEMALGPGGAQVVGAAAGGGDFDAQDNRPTFQRLLALLNEGVAATPIGTIVAFEGEPGRMPAGWVLCNGTSGTLDLRGCWIEATDTPGSIGDPGLSAYAEDHDHTATSPHNHPIPGVHTHTPLTIFDFDDGVNSLFSTPADASAALGHNHGGKTVSTDAQNATEDAWLETLTGDGRTPYRQSHWIQYLGPDDGRAERGSQAPGAPADPEPDLARSILQLRQRIRMVPVCHVPDPLPPGTETRTFTADSPVFSPFDSIEHAGIYRFWLYGAPEALAGSDVSFDVTARADFGNAYTWLLARAEDASFWRTIGRFFVAPLPCGSVLHETITIPAADWNVIWADWGGVSGGLADPIRMKFVPTDVPLCSGSYGFMRISYEYLVAETQEPAPPSHCGHWWRSYEMVPRADGSFGYVWGKLKFDRHLGAFVVAVESPIAGRETDPKVFYGGRGASPEDAEGAHGMKVTECLAPYERRGSIVQVSAGGLCQPI